MIRTELCLIALRAVPVLCFFGQGAAHFYTETHWEQLKEILLATLVCCVLPHVFIACDAAFWQVAVLANIPSIVYNIHKHSYTLCAASVWLRKCYHNLIGVKRPPLP